MAVIGFLLIGASALFFIHIQLKMIRAGYKTSYGFFGINPLSPKGWDTPAQYLKQRKQHGWSPWPVYLLWPCLLAGIIFLVIGLYRL